MKYERRIAVVGAGLVFIEDDKPLSLRAEFIRSGAIEFNEGDIPSVVVLSKGAPATASKHD